MVKPSSGRPRSACLRRALLPALAVSAFLSLSGCKLLTAVLSWSMFPSFLPGLEVTRDLNRELEDVLPAGEEDFEAHLAVLRSPTYGDVDYAFLVVGSPLGARLLVFDTDLDIVNTVDNGRFGQRAMVDAAGAFIVGWERFYGPDDPVPDRPAVADEDTYRPGVTGSARNCLLSAGGQQLNVNVFTGDWSSSSTSYSATISSVGNWNLAGAGYDAVLGGQEVMLALYGWDSGSLSVLFVDDASLMTAGSLSEPLVDSYTAFTVPLEAVRRVHYTQQGIVVRTEKDDDECYLLDFAGEEIRRFQLRTDGGLSEAYDLEGEHFYYFLRDQRTLYKGRTGW